MKSMCVAVTNQHPILANRRVARSRITRQIGANSLSTVTGTYVQLMLTLGRAPLPVKTHVGQEYPTYKNN